MKQLAFFGAFNPPTVAHLSLAELAMEQTGAESVIFVPSKARYIQDEQRKTGAYSDGERLKLLSVLAEKRPWMQVCDWEMRQDTQPRTYITLCHLRDEGFEPALLLGSDKLPELDHLWMYVREMLEEFGLVCLCRSGDDAETMLEENPFLKSLQQHIRIIRTPEETQHVSSTKVRETLAAIRQLRAALRDMVPEETLPLLLQESSREDCSTREGEKL